MSSVGPKIYNDLVYNENGQIDYTPEANLNLERGMYMGVGYCLSEINKKPMRKYTEWNSLNSHKLTTGTTRQGKSRAMMGDVQQQIALGANVFIGEPKGSEHQEIIGYTLQYAIKYNRVNDIRYVSPYFKEQSEKFNPIYGLKNEQISSLIGEIIESKEPVYKNIGKAITLASCMGLEFIERVNELSNKYDLIIMERMEYAKYTCEPTNKLNKYIWGEAYVPGKHGIDADIKADLEKGQNPLEVSKIEEAWFRVMERYNEKGILDGVFPSRKFFRLKDLSQFEQTSVLKELEAEVRKKLEELPTNGNSELRRLGQEAMAELSKISSRSDEFIGKLGTSYSIVLSELINGDVGYILNECRINPLLDDLTSDSRGVIIIYQPFPMVYKSASDAIGKIMFSMFATMAGYIGASGTLLNRRLYVNIDESGAILSPIVQHLANKGGGLGISLFLYTQSIADIIETLGENLTKILLDNMNTKAFFKGNDNSTAKEIALIMGTYKKATNSTAATDSRDTRSTVAINDEQVVTEGLIQRLPARSFLLKEGKDIYFLKAPHVKDSSFRIIMPIESYGELSRINDEKSEYIHNILARGNE